MNPFLTGAVLLSPVVQAAAEADAAARSLAEAREASSSRELAASHQQLTSAQEEVRRLRRELKRLKASSRSQHRSPSPSDVDDDGGDNGGDDVDDAGSASSRRLERPSSHRQRRSTHQVQRSPQQAPSRAGGASRSPRRSPASASRRSASPHADAARDASPPTAVADRRGDRASWASRSPHRSPTAASRRSASSHVDRAHDAPSDTDAAARAPPSMHYAAAPADGPLAISAMSHSGAMQAAASLAPPPQLAPKHPPVARRPHRSPDRLPAAGETAALFCGCCGVCQPYVHFCVVCCGWSPQVRPRKTTPTSRPPSKSSLSRGATLRGG